MSSLQRNVLTLLVTQQEKDESLYGENYLLAVSQALCCHTWAIQKHLWMLGAKKQLFFKFIKN